jgi:hypothetical protein
MKTKDSIKTDNYYYVQVFDHNIPGVNELKTVCFAENKKEAMQIVNLWLDNNGIGPKRDITLYLKNYKFESRAMVAAGNYIGE